MITAGPKLQCMQVELYQEKDKVVIEFQGDKRDILFSVDIANWAAEQLDHYAGKAAIYMPKAWPSWCPTITVNAIVQRERGVNKPMVHWKLSAWRSKLVLEPKHAINLATLCREAARLAASKLNYKEESNPVQLLK